MGLTTPFCLVLAFLVQLTSQLVQVDLKQFKDTYPEFSNYLLNQTDNRSGPQASKLGSALTSDGNKFLYYNKTINSIEGVSMQLTYSIIRLTSNKNMTLITTTSTILPSATITTPYSTSTASSAVRDDQQPSPQLTHYEPLQQHPASQALLPLYHQFIYTIRISSSATESESGQSGEMSKELIDLLNEQTIESSQLRVKLLKTIGEKLGVNASSLRLNWIEKLDRNRIEPGAKASAPGSNYYYILISLSNINLLDIQKSYSLKITMGTSSSRLKISELRVKYETECESFFKYVQEKHSKKAVVSRKKPVADELSFDLVGLAAEISPAKHAKLSEHIKKVQLLKLCDLKQIYSILTLSSSSSAKDKISYLSSPQSLLPNQLAMANVYIKNSTQEIAFKFKAVKPSVDKTKSTEEPEESETRGEEPENNSSKKAAKVVKLKMKASLLGDVANQTQSEEDEVVVQNEIKYVIDQPNLDANLTGNSTSLVQIALEKANEWFETFKSWMWTVVPQEDVVLAVILPFIVVVSVLVMCVVVSCLLHGCNKNYRKRLKAQKLNSSSSNTAASASSNSTGLDKSSSSRTSTPNTSAASNKNTLTSGHTLNMNTLSRSHHKSNTLFGQKAYLTKGVPVILYEEMSDKPIDDYDENHRSVTDAAGDASDNEYHGRHKYYRSPLIMRNEKPPMPAPPEYTRPIKAPSYTNPINGSLLHDQRLLNELQSILNSDTTTTRLLGSNIE